MMQVEQIRNKYNTLTPAEAKKLNRTLAAAAGGNRQPIRTASVLRKPRAPPIVVTNLDNDIGKQLMMMNTDDTRSMVSQSTLCPQDALPGNGCNSLSRTASIRSSSLCYTTDRRHTVNYGHTQQQGALASRLSLYSTASAKPPAATSYQNNNQQQFHRQFSTNSTAAMTSQITPHESFSNLSFRSTRDAPDGGAATTSTYDPTYRFQTMSVDLGHHAHTKAQMAAAAAATQMTTAANNGIGAYDTMRGRIKYDPQKRASTLNYRFSDDSFSSAKSDLSVSSSNVARQQTNETTPTKYNCTVKEPSRSASKVSLSSSTYKVFQTNIKKFFRGFQKPSTTPTQAAPISGSNLRRENRDNRAGVKQQQQQQQSDTSLNDSSMTTTMSGDSISRLSLNKSQSPPVCPPPPGELKSMSYLESSINYSNYDEFTRLRNERLPRPSGAMMTGNGVGSDSNTSSTNQQHPASVFQSQPNGGYNTTTTTTTLASYTTHKPPQQQQQQHATYDTVANEEVMTTNDELSSNNNWQMTSLPVYYERNLTTVFEEKQASCELSESSKVAPEINRSDLNKQQQRQQQNAEMEIEEEIYQRIKPPERFDDSNFPHHHHQQVVVNSESCELAPSSIASSHSPAPSSIAESVLEFHRQQPATPYRFSFAQPLGDSDQIPLNKDLGLPPRTPVVANSKQQQQQQPGSTNNGNSESKQQLQQQQRQQDNNSSSSGNSSNCSSQINGINHCDNNKTTRNRPTTTDSSLLLGNNNNNSNNRNGRALASENNNNSTSESLSNALDKLSCSMSEHGGGYGNVSGISNDADATILSDESTMEGESGATYYANKCSELERTVVTLKNKLLTKEKELTELQLSQLNNDYTIERLRKQVHKLERENAQLKTMVVTRSASGTSGGATAAATTTIGRIHV